MAPKVREVNMAVKKDDLQRTRPTGADATLGASAQPKPMSQAEAALKEESAGKFDYHLAWHDNCVFDLDEEQHGLDLCVFADGSAVKWDDGEGRILPPNHVLRDLSEALLYAYEYSVRQGREFELLIAGEMFTGTPKEAFGAILRLLDTPIEPPRRVLGLIEGGMSRIQADLEYRMAAMSDAKMLTEAATRLLTSGALDAPSLKHVIELVCKGQEEAHQAAG